jgi:stage V sporulation protein B
MSDRAMLSRFMGLAAGQLLASVVAFYSVVVIADHYGASGLGGLFLIYSLLEYATIFASCGTQLYAIRRVAADPDELGRWITSIMFVRLVAGVIAYGVLVGVSLLVPSFRDLSTLAAVLGLCLIPLALRTAWAPQALHQAPVLGLAQLVTQLVYLAGVLAAIAADFSLLAVALGRVLADLLVSFGLLAWLRQRCPKFGPILPLGELRRMLRDSLPFGGTALLRSLALGSDLVIAGLFVERATLGQYTAASRLFFGLIAMATAYFVVLLPRVAERAGQGRAAMASEISTSMRLAVPVTITTTLAVIVTADLSLSVLFGPDFSQAVVSLRLLSLTLIPYMIGGHYRQVLIASDRQDQDLQISAFGAMVHVVSKLALIPVFGIAGAAAGTLIGETVSMAAQYRAATSELRLRTAAV